MQTVKSFAFDQIKANAFISRQCRGLQSPKLSAHFGAKIIKGEYKTMIYVFLADGFEETEALTTVDILRRASLDVRTVAVKKEGTLVTSSHNITVSADINQNDITEENLEGVILPECGLLTFSRLGLKTMKSRTNIKANMLHST